MAKFEKVKIAGQELNIKFGFNALAVFEKESGESISGLGNYGENIPIRVAICLVYAGLKDGARISKSEFKTGSGFFLPEASGLPNFIFSTPGFWSATNHSEYVHDCGILFKTHFILVAEKYGSINKPVFFLKLFS